MPRSYVKWIGTLADVDAPIIQTLQYVRAGAWSYRTGSPEHGHILQKSTQKLGFPASWSDPSVLPAYGGSIANAVWKSIGVNSRLGVGGLPCEIVHGKIGVSLGLQHSCAANTGLRALKAFLEALVIYIPVSTIVSSTTRQKCSNLLLLFDDTRCISCLYSSLVRRSFSAPIVSSKHSWAPSAVRLSFLILLAYIGFQSALHGLSSSLSSFLLYHMISGMVHLVVSWPDV